MRSLWLIFAVAISVAACGTVRVSGIDRNTRTKVAVADQKAEATGAPAVSTTSATVVADTGQPAKQVDAPLTALVKGYSSAKDYVRDAVQSLQVGEVDAAREDVRAALKLDPNYANAKSLLQQ
ncbi:MAG: hypothetical protein OEW08_00375, partial [Gammaproteobacteria bacterium]|nr:hypothetical protein [Gammaproteobacteria bacterium]